MSKALKAAGQRSAPAVAVRVPEAGSAVAAAMVALALARAREELVETKWYRTAPVDYRAGPPDVRLLRVEDFHVFTSQGGIGTGKYLAPFLVAEATVGPFKATFRVRLEVGRGDLVMMDETAAAS